MMNRIPERKDMNCCLKRLKHELVSMKEAGDGLQNQMSSMMGALQELKLLKMQTALEQLQISCKTSQDFQHYRHIPTASDTALTVQHSHISMETKEKTRKVPEMPKNHTITRESSLSELKMEPSLFLTSSPFNNHNLVSLVPRRLELTKNCQRGSLCNSASFSSSEDNSFSFHDSRDSIQLSDTSRYSPIEDHQPSFHPATMAELQGLMDTLSREGPSIDSDFSQYDTDDSGDWTSSLMSHSRNRQPLVLGDNVIADLVGNWLDLPELESRIADEEENREGISEAPQHSLRLSCSQEFCRRLSLTTSIFKKVLRRVRPDREKLLKDKPGGVENEGETLVFKGHKKNKGSTLKGSFYRPFWMRAVGKEKSRLKQEKIETIKSSKEPTFDYSSAVWV